MTKTLKHFFFFCYPLKKYRSFRGSLVKNLPANAGDMSLIPDLGRSHIPQSSKVCVPQLLSLCSRAEAAMKPVRPRAHALKQEKPLQLAACALQQRVALAPPQLEKSLRISKDPAQPKRSKCF